jgi:hypothetical protein
VPPTLSTPLFSLTFHLFHFGVPSRGVEVVDEIAIRLQLLSNDSEVSQDQRLAVQRATLEQEDMITAAAFAPSGDVDESGAHRRGSIDKGNQAVTLAKIRLAAIIKVKAAELKQIEAEATKRAAEVFATIDTVSGAQHRMNFGSFL